MSLLKKWIAFHILLTKKWIAFHMDALFELSRQLLGELDRPHRRNVPGGTGVVRLLLTGPRGVGKSTWIAQRVIGQYPDYAQSRRCLYLPVDHFRVSGLALYEVAEEFAHLGGELLCLDEVHRADGWSRDLKSIADSFPQLKVIASGSSLLHLERGSHDLSRRYLVAQMEGLSFREYLVLRHQVNFAVVTLEDVLHRHEEHVPDLVVKLKDNGLTVLEAFAEYLERGVYPFSARQCD